MTIDVHACYDLLPPFQLVRGIDLSLGESYVFDVTVNSQYAIASASDNLVRLYDLATLQSTGSCALHTDKISKIKLFNDQYLFSASEDGRLVRWDLRAGGNPVQTFQYDKPLTAFDINCNDSMAVAGTDISPNTQAAELAFFDTRSTCLLSKFVESHGDVITEIQCHPSLPSQLISCSTDGLVNSYDVTGFDEEEALLSVVNSGSSVMKAGYFGPSAEYLYCLTHIETFSLHTLEGDMIYDYGDIRQLDTSQLGIAPINYAIDCSYDPVSQRFYLITGNHAQVF
ncbi:WD repeat-containing protein 89 [Apophysomyces sp. BC1015]|nr:WD repeat-containing protein 89 [Apophysomyces sp. BC1015]KAG0180462.1 WD repeat-containing protein 89 [Apophysomyces sp. BC1021]